MSDALTRYADDLDAEAKRLEGELLEARLQTQDAKIEQLMAQVLHLARIQEQLLATVMEQAKSIVFLTQRDEQPAQVVGRTFEGMPQ